MAPLAVDPNALFGAGSAVLGAGDGLAGSLAAATAGFAVNSGLDAAGLVFGMVYRSTAESLLQAAAAAINALRQNGAKIQTSAANYSKAEAASTLGGGATVLRAPSEPPKFAAPGPPGALGPGEPPPVLWAVVQSFVDDLWPNGDAPGLHAAAGHWRTFGAALGGIQCALDASKSLVGEQQIAEREQMNKVLSQLDKYIAKIGEQCGKLASSLDEFANELAHAQNAIRDLLHRLGSLLDLWHDLVSIFNGDAIDEIRKIAKDIQAVLHNLGREARATQQGMSLGMQFLDGWVHEMEIYMRGQFTHFLGEEVGNPIATVFDTFVNANEGTLKGVFGASQAMENLDPRWFLIDPKGAATTWMDLGKTGMLNLVLNPQEALQADEATLKGLLHLDDWRTDRPGLGLGENIFDGVTLITGVGGVALGARGAAGAARGAAAGIEGVEGAGPVEGMGGVPGAVGEFGGAGGALGQIGRSANGLTKDLESLGGELPKPDPAVGGRPMGLPPRALESAPPVKPPIEATGPTPGRPGEHLPAANPQLVENVPDRAPAHDGTPQGDEYLPAAVHALTSEDLLAISDYTRSGYEDLNAALRSDALDASQHARVEALLNAMRKLPPYDGPVVRGSNLPPEVIARYQPGEVVTESAFVSATTDPAVAQWPSFAGNVEFRILSSTGRDVSSISVFPSEQEILFPAGTKFYVLSRTVDPLTGRTIIEMIER